MRFPLALFLFWVVTIATVRAQPAATIVFFSGNPVLTAANGNERPATRGGELNPGDTVDSRDGRLQLRFLDGASLSLQPGSRFRIDRFSYAGADTVRRSDEGVVMTLIKGTLRTVTGWLGKQDRNHYRMGSTVATIGIRGTEYGATVDDTGLTAVTYAGEIEVCSQAGCLDVPSGKSVWVRAANERPQYRDSAGKAAFESLKVMPEAPATPGGGVPALPAGPQPDPALQLPTSPYGRQSSPTTGPIR